MRVFGQDVESHFLKGVCNVFAGFFIMLVIDINDYLCNL